MAHLLASNPTTSLKLLCSEFSINGIKNAGYNVTRKRHRFRQWENRRGVLQYCCSSSGSSTSTSTSYCADPKLQIENGATNEQGEEEAEEEEEGINANGKKEYQLEYLVCEYGWRVRRLIEKADEIRKTAQVQAAAFHVPLSLFNDLFFQFFQAEVLSGLLYKLNNSPPNRYACLVAEAATNNSDSPKQIVGVVDVTVSRDENVLQHLPPEAQECLYISGIAVSTSFRRRKIATALLKACDVLSILWGFEFLALRAYEEDWGARKLYSNAGYEVVARDPPWMSTWIGKKCRVLMIKRSNLPN